MSWDYGTLATEIYEIDKPIGHSFGDVEFYAGLLAGAVTGRCRDHLSCLTTGAYAAGN
jgi:hypothetical protein